jgi:DNA-binding transcriptional LysR family regulator
MAEYLDCHPEVNLDLELSNRKVDLVEEGLDAAVHIGPMKDTSMVARPLRPLQMIVCAAPAYLERHGTPRTPADLSQHRCMDAMHWRHGTRWRLANCDEARPPAPRLRSNNGDALRRAAIAGLGVVLQAEAMLADEVARGRLVPILHDYWPVPRPMHLVYQRDRQSTPKLASFVEFVVERFGLR